MRYWETARPGEMNMTRRNVTIENIDINFLFTGIHFLPRLVDISSLAQSHAKILPVKFKHFLLIFQYNIKKIAALCLNFMSINAQG